MDCYLPDWNSLDTRPTPTWFADAKLGVFIHWGPYSVPAWGPKRDSVKSPGEAYAEWYGMHMRNPESQVAQYHAQVYGPDFPYPRFADLWQAENFDPDAWARIFRSAGAQYAVLTSKHHDGFCLWPSAEAGDWHSVARGPRQDLVAAVGEAVRHAGLRMGLYFSLQEWWHPLWDLTGPREAWQPERFVEELMLPQLRDLICRYEPTVLFTDGQWIAPASTWRSQEFLAWLFNESPVREHIAVNDRWGCSTDTEKATMGRHGGFFTPEYDEISHEEKILFDESHPWVECRGIGTSFGYNRNEDTADYLSEAALIRLFVDKVTRGGGMLLNVGPTADGRIPVIQQERLEQLGAWLRVNGEAVYGSRRWRVVQEGDNVRYTRGRDAVYAFLNAWPGRDLHLREPEWGGWRRARLLGCAEPVEVLEAESGIRLRLPALGPDDAPCRHVYVLELMGAQ